MRNHSAHKGFGAARSSLSLSRVVDLAAQLIQELNNTKRLLNAARMDHYELFRLYQRLKVREKLFRHSCHQQTHDNADVLVPMLQGDTGDKDTQEVLAVLARCLTSR